LVVSPEFDFQSESTRRVRIWKEGSLVCLMLLLFLCAAVFYSGALLQVIGSCLGVTLFPNALLPLAACHEGVACTAIFGGEHTRGCRICCTSADCTKRSSSCVDISVSSSKMSLSFSPQCMGPTRPAVVQKNSLKVSVWCYKTLYETWMQTATIRCEMVVSYNTECGDSHDKIPIDLHGSMHHSTIHKEKPNKMRQCIKTLLFHIYMKLNMFWVTHHPSSGA
jgi:hypothetical protein